MAVSSCPHPAPLSSGPSLHPCSPRLLPSWTWGLRVWGRGLHMDPSLPLWRQLEQVGQVRGPRGPGPPGPPSRATAASGAAGHTAPLEVTLVQDACQHQRFLTAMLPDMADSKPSPHGWEAGNGGGTHKEGPLHQACPQHPGAGFSPGQRVEGLGPTDAHTLGGKASLLLRCLVSLLPGPHPHKRAAPSLTRSCIPAFIPKSADMDLPWRRSDSLGRDTAAPLLSPDISLVGPHGNPVSAASPAPSGIQTSWSVTFGTQSSLFLFLRLS